MKKIMIACVLGATIMFGGCAGGLNSQQQKQVALVISKCPVLKTYTRAQMEKAASELKVLPSESQVAVMVTDYGKLRDACRVAAKKLKKSSKK